MPRFQLTPEQAPKIKQWLRENGGVQVWGEPDENAPRMFSPADKPQKPHPHCPPRPLATSRQESDFEVILTKEIYSRLLPAPVRPGVRISRELQEAYEHDLDQAAAGKNCVFQFRPDSKQPWRTRVVVLEITETIPLEHWQPATET